MKFNPITGKLIGRIGANYGLVLGGRKKRGMFGVIDKLSSGIEITDEDVIAFMTATAIPDNNTLYFEGTDQEITGSNLWLAINTLVLNAKENGWWDLLDAAYPFIGGTSSTHKWNLKDPRDLDAAYRLTFTGGFTHSGTGCKGNGTDAWANPYIVGTDLDDNSAHLSFYSRTSISNNAEVDIGSISGDSLYLQINFSNEAYFENPSLHAANLGTTGLFLGTKVSVSESNLYRNENLLATSASSAANPATAINIFRSGGIESEYSTKDCPWASIGSGVSSVIYALMEADIEEFQTSLNRNV